MSKIDATKGRSILDILKDHNIPYTDRGNTCIAFCVKHDDRNTPNMVIYPETNTFFCFTCHFGSRPEHLVAHLDKCSREEAISAVYGEDYLKLMLRAEKRKTKENLFPLKLILSRAIHDRLKLGEVKDFSSKLDSIMKAEVSSKKILELVEQIKGW